jgi:hypothetical protein
VPPNMSPRGLLKTVNELLVPPILDDMSWIQGTSENSETTANLRIAEGLCQWKYNPLQLHEDNWSRTESP